jgi:hypothetical protein
MPFILEEENKQPSTGRFVLEDEGSTDNTVSPYEASKIGIPEGFDVYDAEVDFGNRVRAQLNVDVDTSKSLNDILGRDPIKEKAPKYKINHQFFQPESLAARTLTLSAGNDADVVRTDLERIPALEDKLNYLQETLPDFQFRVANVDGADHIMFREPDSLTFKPIDRPSKYDAGDIPELATYFTTASGLGSILAGVATGGQGLLLRSAAQAGAQGLGELASTVMTTAQGYDTRSTGEKAGDIATMMALAPIGEAIGSTVAGGVNFARGRRVGVDEYSQRARQAAKNLGFSDLTPGQISELLRRQEMQLEGLSSYIGDYKLSQKEQVFNYFKSQVEDLRGLQTLNNTEVDRLVRKRRANLLDTEFALKNSNIDPTTGGKNLFSAVNRYYLAGREQSKRLYGDAIKIAEDKNPIFHLGTLTKGDEAVVSEILAAPSFKASDRYIAKLIKSGNKDLAKKINREGLNLDNGVSEELKEIASTLKNADPNVGNFAGFTGFEQLQALRTRLFDLKTLKPGELPDYNNKLANKLYDGVTKVIENPSTRSGKDFSAAWKKANDFYREFATTLNRDEIVRIRSAEANDLPTLVSRFGDEANPESLRLLRNTLNDKEWGDFKTAYKGSLLRNPEKINQVLDSFSTNPNITPYEKRALITPSDELALRSIGTNIEQLNNSKVVNFLRNSGSTTERALDLAQNGKISEVKQWVDTGKGDVKTALRMGILSDILDSKVSMSKGKEVPDLKTLQLKVEKYKQSGLIDLVFDKKQKQELLDTQLYVSFLNDFNDSGASLQAASKTANAFDFTQLFSEPMKMLQAWAHLSSASTQSRILLSPKFSSMVFGDRQIVKPKRFDNLKTVSDYLVNVSSQMGRTTNDYKQQEVDDFFEEQRKKRESLIQGGEGAPELGGGPGNDTIGQEELPVDVKELLFYNFKKLNKSDISDLDKAEIEGVIQRVGEKYNKGYDELVLQAIPNKAKELLRTDPSLAEDFDARYGIGTSKLVLGR